MLSKTFTNKGWSRLDAGVKKYLGLYEEIRTVLKFNAVNYVNAIFTNLHLKCITVLCWLFNVHNHVRLYLLYLIVQVGSFLVLRLNNVVSYNSMMSC